MLKIRKAVTKDLERILEIYAYAREVMKNSGNPDQWGDFQPPRELVEYDISVSRAYVMEEEKIHGVFVIIEGDDPLYKSIDGRWLDDGDYISRPQNSERRRSPRNIRHHDKLRKGKIPVHPYRHIPR